MDTGVAGAELSCGQESTVGWTGQETVVTSVELEGQGKLANQED